MLHQNKISSIVRDVELEWHAKGGAWTSCHVPLAYHARTADVAIIMVGGNDLTALSPVFVAGNVQQLAELLLSEGAKSVVIMGYLPRADPSYNEKIDLLHTMLKSRYPKSQEVLSRIRFWAWDKRLPLTRTDNVHLMPSGYRRAAIYISSAILHAINYIL